MTTPSSTGPCLPLNQKLKGFHLIAQEKLEAIICSIPGKKKNLILEETLIKPLEHICAASWLKLKGIQRIYKYETEHIIARAADQVHIYMIRSDLRTLQSVLRQLQVHARQQAFSPVDIKYFHIICVPSCFSYFQLLLEEEGLFGVVQLHRFSWDFIYLDDHVLSLELCDVFPSIYMQQNSSLLPAIACSLRVLQMICGRPDLILTYGESSETIVKMLDTLGPWSKTPESQSGDFSVMLIIDRDKDFVSSLLTPALYAGLLLEVFTNRAGEITIDRETNKILSQKLKIFMPPSKHRQEPQENEKTKPKAAIIRLNAESDEIYGDNRYKHFAQASSLVRAQAKAIGLEVQKLNDMKLDEMHDYVARKLPKITELKSKILRHLNASEIVIEMLAANFRKVQSLEEEILNNVSRKRLLNEIDELLTTDGQQYNTLRLFCLLHLCAGIAPDELSSFVRNYCNYFGHQYLPIFHQLASAGLLPYLQEDEKANKSAAKLLTNPLRKFQQTEFQANANRLKLLVSTAGEDVSDSASPSSSLALQACPSYVFNSLYIPLAAQLCSILLKAISADDINTKLGVIDKLHMHLPKCTNPASSAPLSVKSYTNLIKAGSNITNVFPLRQPNIFVFIVGGVTYAEIGACQRLPGAQIVVSSDCIISGRDMIAGAF